MLTKFHAIRKSLACLSIYKRIAIGNSIIIVAGAVVGTLVTRQLTSQAVEFWLILLFATLGISISILVNNWLIRTALNPLRELSATVKQVQTLPDAEPPSVQIDSDPDICQLANGLNALLFQLEERNRQLRALSDRAILAQEEERKRIALSLHDDTGQALSMIIINLERIARAVPSDAVELRSRLERTHALARQTLDELRKIIYGLRPTMLDDLGLIPAIRWYARTNLEEAGIRTTVNGDPALTSLDSQVSITLFRIAQEAVNNIVRHSSAKNAWISLTRQENCAVLEINDDGSGFDVSQTSSQAITKQQWGLLGIIERADLVGGEVVIDSKPGRGTRLRIQIPLTAAEVAANE